MTESKKITQKDLRMQAAAKESARQNIVEEHQEFVKSLVFSMMKTMNLPADQQDDFLAAGYLGLVEAAERYDPNSGCAFTSFAYLRIRGAVIDCIRKHSDISGRGYKYVKALQAIQEMRESDSEQTYSTDEEQLEAKDKLAYVLEQAAKGVLAFRLNFADLENEEPDSCSDTNTPEDIYNLKQGSKILRSLVATLPEKERLVIEECYFKDKTITEVASENEGLSKSWASRLHSRALSQLKEKYIKTISG